MFIVSCLSLFAAILLCEEFAIFGKRDCSHSTYNQKFGWENGLGIAIGLPDSLCRSMMKFCNLPRVVVG